MMIIYFLVKDGARQETIAMSHPAVHHRTTATHRLCIARPLSRVPGRTGRRFPCYSLFHANDFPVRAREIPCSEFIREMLSISLLLLINIISRIAKMRSKWPKLSKFPDNFPDLREIRF